MSFAFKRKESVGKAIRRLGCGQNREALSSLKRAGADGAVHDARKGIKKERALLRLARRAISKGDYRRQMKLLREAALLLSSVRDARVVAKASKELHRLNPGKLPSKVWRRSQKAFDKVYRGQLRQFRKDKTCREARRLLKKSSKVWRKLDVKMKGWKAISGGLNASYCGGQRAYHSALTDPTPEKFHAWRKRVKDLSCETRLLLPILPDQMEAIAADLKKLSDILGADHDMVVLGEAAANRGRLKHGSEVEFFEAIKRRHDELRKAALELGGRFYAESPTAFTERLGVYWHAWRKRKKDVTVGSTVKAIP